MTAPRTVAELKERLLLGWRGRDPVMRAAIEALPDTDALMRLPEIQRGVILTDLRRCTDHDTTSPQVNGKD